MRFEVSASTGGTLHAAPEELMCRNCLARLSPDKHTLYWWDGDDSLVCEACAKGRMEIIMQKWKIERPQFWLVHEVRYGGKRR